MKIYFAGPLFTGAEKQWNEEAAWLLRELGHEVWLPQEKEPRELSAQAVFEMDKAGMDWSEVTVAIMDGTDPDSGTSFECGYTYAVGKPIVTVRTDIRNNNDLDARFNLMLHASANKRVYAPNVKIIDVVIEIDKALKLILLEGQANELNTDRDNQRTQSGEDRPIGFGTYTSSGPRCQR